MNYSYLTFNGVSVFFFSSFMHSNLEKNKYPINGRGTYITSSFRHNIRRTRKKKKGGGRTARLTTQLRILLYRVRLMPSTTNLSFATRVKISNITQQLEDLVLDLRNDPIQSYEAYTLLQMHFEHALSVLDQRRCSEEHLEEEVAGGVSSRCDFLRSQPTHLDNKRNPISGVTPSNEQKMFSRVVSSPSPQDGNIGGSDIVRLQRQEREKEIPHWTPAEQESHAEENKVPVRTAHRCGSSSFVAPASKGELSPPKHPLDGGVWINVWPCFGTHTASFSKPTRVFVRARYRYMEDVTEIVAKSLNCQPAPTALYEPQGKEIRSLAELRHNGHYLFFPSGGFYRREAVPAALLNTLVEEARKAMRE